MAKGIDYAFNPHPSIASLKSAGVTFVARYVSAYGPNDSNGKNLLAAERASLSAAGLSIVIVAEEGQSRMLGGYSAGVADAQHADAVVKALGMSGIPVYFAADWDCSPGDQASVNAYLDGAASVIGFNRVGIYGGYYPVKRALDAGKARYAWQTYAWSGQPTLWDSRAQLRQTQNDIRIGSAACDLDESRAADFGQWPRPAVAPPVFHGEYVTGGMFDLADLAAKLGQPVNSLLRMTAVHYGAYDPVLATWLADVLSGRKPWNTPVPKGAKLWVD